jgi:hypothetical protein
MPDFARPLGLGGVIISSPDQIADRVVQVQHVDPQLIGIQDSGDIRVFTDVNGDADIQWVYPRPYPEGQIPFVWVMRIGVTGEETKYPTIGVGIGEQLANIRIRGDWVFDGTIFIRALAIAAGDH